jgi:hypothetical protein
MRGNERNVVRAIRGPVTLITIGGLFALNNFTQYRFDQTWPVILIVFGLLSLLGRSMDRVVPPPPPNPTGWYQPPPPPPGAPPQGSYAGSSYTGMPAGTAKGGFGTSAPPKSSDSGDPSGGSV